MNTENLSKLLNGFKSLYFNHNTQYEKSIYFSYNQNHREVGDYQF